MTATATKPLARRESSSPEGNQIDAVAQLPRDLAIIKMENENIMAMAAAHPRDYGEVLSDIKSQLQHFRSFAESAIYAKPVGREEKCPKCGGKSGYKPKCPNRDCGADIPMKIARGLSIRAAEAIAAAYKYNRVRADVTDLDADKVRIEATFVDYQAGRLWQDSTVLSKVFRKNDGTVSRTPDDRFYGVVVQARKSILIRECINRIVPPGLRSELFEAAEEELAKTLDDAKINQIVTQFGGIQVTVPMLEQFLGKKVKELNKHDRKILAGVWVAIRDGETTVQEAFGTDDSGPVNNANETAKGVADAINNQKPTEKSDTSSAPSLDPAEIKRMCEAIIKGDSITKFNGLKKILREETVDAMPKDATVAGWQALLDVLREVSVASTEKKPENGDEIKEAVQKAREVVSDKQAKAGQG